MIARLIWIILFSPQLPQAAFKPNKTTRVFSWVYPSPACIWSKDGVFHDLFAMRSNAIPVASHTPVSSTVCTQSTVRENASPFVDALDFAAATSLDALVAVDPFRI